MKVLESRKPDWIPCAFGLSPASWIGYRQKLEAVVIAHSGSFDPRKRRARDFDSLVGPYARGGEHDESQESHFRFGLSGRNGW